MKNIDLNRLNHAYIIESKNEQLLEEECENFAKEIVDFYREDNININEVDRYSDIVYVKPEKNNISIDTVRSIIGDIYIAPIYSNKKVYLIYNAELMNIQGQNALLKSLEEPPEYIVFILATLNTHKLLETIVSRGQLIKIESELEETSIDRRTLYEILAKTIRGNELEMFSNMDFFNQYSDKQDKKSLFKEVINFFRDINRYKYLGDEYIINNQYSDIIKKNSYLSFLNLENIICKVEELYSLMDVNLNYQLAIESMILGIWEEVNEKNGRS